MPDWLSDPPAKLYLLLLIVGVLALLAAFLLVGGPKGRDRKQKKSSTRPVLLGIAAIAFLLMAGVKVCDTLYESDREQIVRKMNEMSQGVLDRNLDRTFQHVSESFRYGSTNKAQLRARGDDALRSGQVTEIAIWDVTVDPIQKGDTKAAIQFRFKVKGTALNENQFIGKGIFVRDPDGQWRLQSFEVFPPTGTRDPFIVPGL